MKHDFSTRMLCLVFVLLCLPIFALAYEPVPDDILYVVNNPNPADRLNLRAKPDASAPSLGRYYNGVRLGALSQPSNGWINVYAEGTSVTGYMQTQYLVYNPSTPVPSAIPLVTINNKNGTGLTLREEPSSASKDIGLRVVRNGETVSALGWGANWCHVRAENLSGYMLTSGLSFDTTDSGNSSANIAVVSNPDSTDRLNLRSYVEADGRAGDSIGKYYSGVQVEIEKIFTQGSMKWAFVRVGALKRAGYMRADFLVIDAMPGQVTSAMPVVEVKNPKSADHLNLRAEPSEKASSLGRYLNGTKVTVLGVVNSTWSHVNVYGVEGFMMNMYLSPKPSFIK